MTPTEQAYELLVKTIEKHNPEADMPLISAAYAFAANAHKGQFRQSGEPYIIHPIYAAINLAKLNMDSQALAAGLLHDVIEDTPVTAEQLEKEFGKQVAYLVEGVTNLGQVRFNEKNQYIENLRKMFVATAKDIRVLLIRMCDRLHNIQTLEFLPTIEQRRIALETLEIYAPIAHRLQVGSLRVKLEDGAFKHLQPEQYHELHNSILQNYQTRQTLLKKSTKKIEELLTQEQISPVMVTDRIKGVYSLHKKLQRYDNDLSKIYDVIAIRIIVPKMPDCYAAMGLVHSIYKPIKGRIKDYIARPKPNGYQSLHTTVLLPNGDFLEIQFRTPRMHEAAEYGVAAHWMYKQGKPTASAGTVNIDWIKELAKIIKTIENTQDLEHIKLDMFQNRIFCLTPKGDVIDLPNGATPIDFAYQIHTDLGNQMTRAKINGEIVPPQATLQNGDIVELLLDKKKKSPDLKWLDYVKTNYAMSKIKQAHRKRLADWQKNLKTKTLR